MILCNWSDTMGLDRQWDITILLCDHIQESQLNTDNVRQQNRTNKPVCLLGNIQKIQQIIFSVIS